MCKEFLYKILNYKKLDWLKREEVWKFDKIDKITGVIFLIFFSLAIFAKGIFVFLLFIIFIPLMILGEIRHIKTVPQDIESAFLRSLIRIKFIFATLIGVTFFVIILSI